MNGVIIISVRSFDPFEPMELLTYPGTPEGWDNAKKKFGDWVRASAAHGKPHGVLVGDLDEVEEIVDNATSEGLYQVGAGGFTLCQTEEG